MWGGGSDFHIQRQSAWPGVTSSGGQFSQATEMGDGDTLTGDLHSSIPNAAKGQAEQAPAHGPLPTDRPCRPDQGS